MAEKPRMEENATTPEIVVEETEFVPALVQDT
jgi:hypothetical protein